jgi:Holliday junction resolvase RusA-like endonuclease
MHPWGTWKTSKPDTDNLIKMIKDEMTRLGFWGDDAQICSEWSAKLYGRTSGVFIKITELEKEIKT